MVPRLENVFNKSIYFPSPSHQNVCRDINQFPSLLDNFHQPLKHALLFITHLKINHQSNQQTIFWPCTLQVQPHFSAPLHSKTLKKLLVFPFSISSIPFLFPAHSDGISFHTTPLKGPLSRSPMTYILPKKCSSLFSFYLTFWQHWTYLINPSFLGYLLEASISHYLGFPCLISNSFLSILLVPPLSLDSSILPGFSSPFIPSKASYLVPWFSVPSIYTEKSPISLSSPQCHLMYSNVSLTSLLGSHFRHFKHNMAKAELLILLLTSLSILSLPPQWMVPLTTPLLKQKNASTTHDGCLYFTHPIYQKVPSSLIL